ncbi:redoxin family protein [Pseudocnuella soli]|uniref:redoxin family protein n=1 Tax=Pseudocnuella soli TaxID=2502779 RepID=UPI0010529395|nr:redoxin family protein [Pseudocnuella soli]
MFRKQFLLLLLCTATTLAAFSMPGDQPKTLAIGSSAPPFSLKGTDGKTYTLQSFKGAKILALVFTCNHCPTAQAYEERLIQLAKDYAAKGVALVAVSPNDPKAVRLDELGYSDLNDSYAEMKIRAKEKSFNFPYLYDGDTQAMSLAYGPVATPHVFIFDADRKLRYQGRIDDVENPAKKPNTHDARNALDALLQGSAVPVAATKVFGCSVKWAEKEEGNKKAMEQWMKEPVALEGIDEAGVKELLENKGDKLRLINVWATWCGPCVIEFPDFVAINRMYRGRDFEFISVSADSPEKRDKALKFLKEKGASNKNYIFNHDDKYKLIEAIDPQWGGALPYTILVEPGGKIVYRKQATINPQAIKKMIVDHQLIGRVY